MTTDAVTEFGTDLDLEFEGVSLDETPQTAEPAAEPIDQAGAQRGETQPQPQPQAPARVDLTTLPEFREVQSKYDRRYDDLNRRFSDLVQRYQVLASQAQSQVEQQQLAGLDEADSLEARQKIIDDMVNARTKRDVERQLWERTEQERTWRAYVDEQAKKQGQDPNAFLDKPYQSREEFELDLGQAVLEDLRKKVKQLESGAAPEAVQKKVELAAHEAGYNAIDTGTPKMVAEPDSWDRDCAALQSGRMDPKKFAEKWRGK